jgi:hypothetical protein
MTTIFQRVEAFLKNDLVSIEQFFTGEVWPALKTFLTSTIEEEVAAIVPILEGALPSILKDPAALFTASGWAAVANELTAVVLPAIEATGKQIASESLHTAIGAVLAKTKASATGA